MTRYGPFLATAALVLFGSRAVAYLPTAVADDVHPLIAASHILVSWQGMLWVFLAIAARLTTHRSQPSPEHFPGRRVLATWPNGALVADDRDGQWTFVEATGRAGGSFRERPLPSHITTPEEAKGLFRGRPGYEEV